MARILLTAEFGELRHHGAANVERIENGGRKRGFAQCVIDDFSIRRGELRLLRTSGGVSTHSGLQR
ncbi:hypothetical protein [Burkholderia pseudomallei]|uniref:hypothetical protein n=1 Tax=Burkholderia pseudomallei TaxID=28450 RepID=UPI0004644453|nr:hypothetical protein [Burkholderia pseudomallei]KEO66136.1 hypothetical protein J103_30240 [Burkholderia pseudomallei MSHR5855]MBF3380873.1 hypothetical protein [Burkholderia pseudomallei]MBF3404805.1 hypothetical protein [Burkholderia pseudomallei]MBF3634379.1 hypothetical protein [Burkholderia pseudomallei]MBF3651098.1 hypothetical protein [Burkholderia pseudomallei]